MRIVAFNGGYGVGKSTAIKCLQEVFPDKSFHLVKFAGPLYDMQEYIYGRISSVIQRPANFAKDRKLLQWLGTEWGRGLDQNLWTQIWTQEVKTALESDSNVIIVCDDARFDNEAELVKSLGGTIIKLVRTDNAKHAEGGTGIANHASEAGINPALVDHIVKNDSTLDDFKFNLQTVFESLGIN